MRKTLKIARKSQRNPQADLTVAGIGFYRRETPVARPAQIIRAVLIGLLFAFIFLWAVPQHRLLYAGMPDVHPLDVHQLVAAI